MAESKDGRPFYERRWFQGTVAVVGLVGAVGALTGGPLWDSIADLFSEDLPSSNTEIVLDASAGMTAPFDGETKLAAAANAIGAYVIPRQSEGFALRRFGGGCDEAGELLVDFGEDHGDDVRAAAAKQQATGESNLANAVIAAIDDFSDADRFPDPEAPKRVLIFAGTADQCIGDAAADAIGREVARRAIDIEFQLIGMRPTEQEREQLGAITNAIGRDAELVEVETVAQLEEMVEMPAGTTGPEGALAPETPSAP